MAILSSDLPPYIVLARVEGLGITVRVLPDGSLKLRPASAVPPELVEAVRRHKPAIAELLRLRLAEPRRLPEREPST